MCEPTTRTAKKTPRVCVQVQMLRVLFVLHRRRVAGHVYRTGVAGHDAFLAAGGGGQLDGPSTLAPPVDSLPAVFVVARRTPSRSFPRASTSPAASACAHGLSASPDQTSAGGLRGPPGPYAARLPPGNRSPWRSDLIVLTRFTFQLSLHTKVESNVYRKPGSFNLNSRPAN